MKKDTRFWYTLMGPPAWRSGWCFGATPEAAADKAAEYEAFFGVTGTFDVALSSVADYADQGKEPWVTALIKGVVVGRKAAA